MPKRSQLALFLLLALLVLTSCGPQAISPTVPPPAPTSTPRPTVTPPPTATRRPTATAQPTATPVPTASASPTPTAESSATPRPTPAATEVPAPTATPEVVLTPLGQLPGLSGQEVTVQATVVGASSFAKGFKFLLDDGTGQATLLMWLNVYDDCWDAPQLKVGATVQAHGKVGQYEGAWEVEAGYGGDVRVLSPAAPLPVTPIGSIGVSNVNTWVAIEGAVERAEGSSGGQQVYLNDGTGTMLVWLWQSVFDRVKDNARLLTPGTRVHVEGLVQEYKGAPEVVPAVPFALNLPHD